MKRQYFLLLIFFTYSFCCFAAPIDKIAARKIAEKFYEKEAYKDNGIERVRSNRKTTLQLDYICQESTNLNKRLKTNIESEKERNLYYVFNADNNNGFVIVAGDDKAGKVLAYSTTGCFSQENLPENLEFWMEAYKNAISAIIDDEISIDRASADATDNSFAPKVLPLLGKEGILWGQGKPFNDDCPLDTLERKSVVGCLATALGQIMRYHKHPEKGIGTKTYTSKRLKKDLSVDFSKASYNWGEMLPEYGEKKYNDGQKKEVAKLLYHIGVAVEMEYSSRESSAIGKMGRNALINYFDYNKNIRYLNRELYSNIQWDSIIKKELTEKRPIMYDGQSKRGGHAFVCDGYDANNLFHINWGWEGSSDGYFDLTILEPRSQGIGGGSGGYSSRQSILIGIQTKNDDLKPDLENQFFFSNMQLPNPLKFPKRNAFDIKINNLENKSYADYRDGVLRLVLKNESSEYYVLKSTKFNLKSSYLYENYYLDNSKLPQNTPNGSYKLILQVKKPNSNEYYTVSSINDSDKDITVEISDSHVEFKHKKLAPQLEVIGKFDIKNKKFYQKREVELTAKIKNSGNATFRSKLAAVLQNSTGSITVIDSISLGIEIGETKTLRFKSRINIAEPGDYTLKIMYSDPNNERGKLNKDVGAGELVEIQAEPINTNFKCTNLKYAQRTARGEDLKLSFDVTNESETDLFYDDFTVLIFKRINAKGNYNSFRVARESIEIASGETKTIYFEIETESLIDGKSLAEELKMEKDADAPYLFWIRHNSKKIIFDTVDQFLFYISPRTPPNKPILSCTPGSLDETLIITDALSIELPIINSGKKYEKKPIRIDFVDEYDRVHASIEKDQTVDKKLKIKLEDNDETKKLLSGKYAINILYKDENNKYIAMEGKYMYLDIEVAATKLDLEKNTNNANPKFEPKFNLTKEFKYAAKVYNEGGFFKEEIYLDIIPSENLKKMGAETTTLTAELSAPRASASSAVFTSKLDESKYKIGSYTLQLKLKKKTVTRNQQEFVKIGDPIKIQIVDANEIIEEEIKTPLDDINITEDETSKIKVLQNGENLEIKVPENSQTIYIYDLQGELIHRHELMPDEKEFIFNTSKLGMGIFVIVAEGNYEPKGKQRRISEKVFVR